MNENTYGSIFEKMYFLKLLSVDGVDIPAWIEQTFLYGGSHYQRFIAVCWASQNYERINEVENRNGSDLLGKCVQALLNDDELEEELVCNLMTMLKTVNPGHFKHFFMFRPKGLSIKVVLACIVNRLKSQAFEHHDLLMMKVGSDKLLIAIQKVLNKINDEQATSVVYESKLMKSIVEIAFNELELAHMPGYTQHLTHTIFDANPEPYCRLLASMVETQDQSVGMETRMSDMWMVCMDNIYTAVDMYGDIGEAIAANYQIEGPVMDDWINSYIADAHADCVKYAKQQYSSSVENPEDTEEFGEYVDEEAANYSDSQLMCVIYNKDAVHDLRAELEDQLDLVCDPESGAIVYCSDTYDGMSMEMDFFVPMYLWSLASYESKMKLLPMVI